LFLKKIEKEEGWLWEKKKAINGVIIITPIVQDKEDCSYSISVYDRRFNVCTFEISLAHVGVKVDIPTAIIYAQRVLQTILVSRFLKVLVRL